MAFIKSLQIGRVKEIGGSGDTPLARAAASAFIKEPVAQARLTPTGFAGDEVADTRHHGGVDKAVFTNSYDNYPAWAAFLGRELLPFGALGENLTIAGLDETTVCIGDLHRMGEVVLQVSQPRKPCFKIGKRWQNADFTAEILRSGRTGWYYRVVEEGEICSGAEVEIVERDTVGMSVQQVNDLFNDPAAHEALLGTFFTLTALPESWFAFMEKRAAGRMPLDSIGYMKQPE